jgi:hypothetical protein
MKSVIASLLVALVALPVPMALAKQKPAFVDTGRAYRPLRLLLWKTGWHVAGKDMRHDGSCPETDARCKRFSEAVDCSGTGLGFCNMAWRHKDGTLLIITTAGEKALVVHHWEVKR